MHAEPDARLAHLLAFADDVLTVCYALGIDPFLDRSMAVRAHSQDHTIVVGDIDLNCPEAEFSRLERALSAAGIFCEIQPRHVLQVRRDGVKVEFGATEVWTPDITGPFETFRLGTHTVRMVDRDTLRRLYQRGLEATAGNPGERDKHTKIASRLRALDVSP